MSTAQRHRNRFGVLYLPSSVPSAPTCSHDVRCWPIPADRAGDQLSGQRADHLLCFRMFKLIRGLKSRSSVMPASIGTLFSPFQHSHLSLSCKKWGCIESGLEYAEPAVF
jgi:hypothetical protein